jgi:hypothetical protein
MWPDESALAARDHVRAGNWANGRFPKAAAAGQRFEAKVFVSDVLGFRSSFSATRAIH